MEIIIERFAVCGMALHGRLKINGEHVCDTLERMDEHLPPGCYAVETKVSKGVVRFVGRNGPYTLGHGEIAIGECHYLGFLIRCEEYHVPLMARIRMAQKRRHTVTVIIREDGDGHGFYGR